VPFPDDRAAAVPGAARGQKREVAHTGGTLVPQGAKRPCLFAEKWVGRAVVDRSRV
jgi:hypothetical protein